jgi:hypothetical protein
MGCVSSSLSTPLRWRSGSELQCERDRSLGCHQRMGVCPCVPTMEEPNDICSQIEVLTTVGSNQKLIFADANLHYSNDNDLYKIRGEETDSTCSCCDGPGCADEDFRLIIQLIVPEQAPGPYLFCTGATCGLVFNNCVPVNPGQEGEFIWTFDGGCQGIDTFDIYVHVGSLVGGNTGCTNYTLVYQLLPGCY